MEEKKSYYAVIPANVRYDKGLPANAKLLYGEITALCNSEGYCWASNRYFADLYEVTNTSISKWIKALCDAGYIKSKILYKEGTKEIDKRYITIVNYPIEEKLNTPIKEKLKENNTSFNNTSNNTKNNIISEFETLWKMYPRKQGKTKALKAYQKAIKEGVSFETVEQGIKDYCEYIKKSKTKAEYIKHGSTWFNGYHWNDEYTEGKTEEKIKYGGTYL